MNKIYRTVYNETTNTWVAVEETAKSHRKSSGGVVDSTPTAACERVSGSLKLRGLTAAVAIALFSPLAVSPAFALPPTPSGTTHAHTQIGSSDGDENNNIVTGTKDTVWGDMNTVSNGSTAFGQSNKATGDKSTAFGNSNHALGNQSTAFGVDNVATGSNSTAFGQENLAGYIGTDVASLQQMGINTVADFCKAIGAPTATWCKNKPTLAAAREAAVGTQFDDESDLASALGVGGVSGTKNATAWGLNNLAGNKQATAFGSGNRAYGENSSILGGEGNEIGRFKLAPDPEDDTGTKEILKLTRELDDDESYNYGTNAAILGGKNNKVSGENAVAWGLNNLAGNKQATAFGEKSIANGVNSTAFGKDSYAYADNSLAALGGKVGDINTADATHYEDPNNDGVGLNSVAIGDGAWVQSDNSVAMGQNSVVGKNADKSLAMIGGQVSKNATGAIAMGNNAQAQSPHSVSIGTNAVTMNRTGTIAIGAGNPNLAGNGHNTSGALAGNVGAIAIGRKAEAVNATLNVLYDTDGYAYVPETIGTETLTNNVGESFNRDYSYSRTIAPDNSNIMQMVAIGEDVSAYADQAIAIGSNTIAAGNASIAMGGDDVGRDGRPAKAHFQDVQNELKDLQTELTNNGYQVPVTLKNATSNADAFKDRTLALGDVSMALGMKAVSQGDLSNAIGMGARTIGANSNAIGTVAFAGAENSVALGSVAMTDKQAEKSVAVGYMAQTGGEIALGDVVSLQIDPADKTKGTKKFSVNGEEEQELSELGSVKIDDKGVEHKGVYTGTGVNSVAVGEHNKVLGDNSTAVGQGNIIIGNNSGAFGDPNVIIGNDSKALGNDNVVAANKAFVVGNNVNKTADNSVFLGDSAAYVKAEDDLTADDAGSTAGVSRYVTNAKDIKSLDQNGKEQDVVIKAGKLKFAGDGMLYTYTYTDPVTNKEIKETVAVTAKDEKDANGKDVVNYYAMVNGVETKINESDIHTAGVVSVGDVGQERRIQNVAAGLIDAQSTDAINGSQLYSVIQNLQTGGGSPIDTDNRNVGLATIDGTQTIVSPYINVYGVEDASRKLETHIKDKINTTTDWDKLTDAQKQSHIDTWTNEFISNNANSFAQATAQNAVALGYSAQATARNAVALGDSAQATKQNAVAIGSESKAQGQNSVALMGNTITGLNAMGWGNQVTASNLGATAWGNQTKATGQYATAFGNQSVASGPGAVAFGNGSKGVYANASGENSFAQGAGQATNANAVAFNRATASGISSFAVGSSSTVASGSQSVAFGNETQAIGDNSFTWGYGNTASGKKSTAFGKSTTASGENATAWGQQSTASGINATAFGDQSQANADNSLAALGGVTNGADSAAIGQGAETQTVGSVALGSGSVAERSSGTTGENPLGADFDSSSPVWTANANAIAVGNGSTTTRQITGVAAGTEDTDAVNVAQLKNGVGIKFAGDDKDTDASKTDTENHIAVVKNGGVLDIKGGADTTKLTTGNIGVTYADDHTLNVQLAENVDLGSSGSLKVGGDNANSPTTEIKPTGVTVSQGDNQTDIAPNVINFTDGDSNNTGKITGLANNLSGDNHNQTSLNVSYPTSNLNNAATYSDVLNAGWNLQENKGPKDFVTHGDTVNFADGKNTKAKIVTENNVSTVTIDAYDTKVKAGQGLQLTENAEGDVGEDLLRTYTLGLTDDNQNKIDNAISGLTTAVDGNKAQTLNKDKTQANFITGKNMKLTGNENGITIATDENVEFNNVQTKTLKAGDSFQVDDNGTVTYNKAPENNNDVVNKQYADSLGWIVGDNDLSQVGEKITNDKQVNFVNGKGTTSTVTANGTSGANVAYNLNYKNDGNVQVSDNADGSVSFNAPTTNLTTNGGKVDAPTTGGDNLVTASNVADAINNAGWSVGKGASAANTDALITPAGTNRVGLVEGSGVKIEQDGANFTFKVDNSTLNAGNNKPLQFAGDTGETVSPNFGDTINIVGGNTANNGGKNIQVATDPNNKELSVTLEPNVNLGDSGSLKVGKAGDNQTDIQPNAINFTNNGGVITGLSNNLTDGAGKTSNPSNVSPSNNAATVSDVLNAGWNLQGNDEAKDFVRHNDTVNFVNGDNTEVVVDSNTTTSTIKVNVTTADLAHNTPTYTDGIANIADSEKTKPITAGDAVNIANNVAWNVQGSANGGTVQGNPKKQAIKAGDTVDLVAGNGVILKQEDGKFTFSVDKEAVNTDSVTTLNADSNFQLTDNGQDGNHAYDLKLNNVVNIGDSSSGSPVTIDGNNGVINFTPNATNGEPTGAINNLAHHIGDNGEITNDEPNQAATVQDVLNSGWHLQADGSDVDFVAHNDKVNFASSDKSVTVSGKVENGVDVIDFKVNKNPNQTVSTSNGKVSGGADNTYWDSNQVQNAINNSGFTVNSGKTGTGTNSGNASTLVKTGEEVKFIAGNGVDIAQSGKDFTFSVNEKFINDSVKPLTFTGDGDTQLKPNHGDNIQVKGGAKATDLTDNNIGVVADTSDNSLQVKLNKDVNLTEAGSLKVGKTDIDKDGIRTNSVDTDTLLAGENNIFQVNGTQATYDKVIDFTGTSGNTVVNKTYVDNSRSAVVSGSPNVGVLASDPDKNTGKITYTVKAAGVKSGNDYITVTGGQVSQDGTVTDYTVAFDDSKLKDNINNSGWQIAGNDKISQGKIVNDNQVNFVNGKGTTSSVKYSNGSADVAYDVNIAKGDNNKYVNVTYDDASNTYQVVDSGIDDAIDEAINTTGFDLTTSGNATGTSVERIGKDGKVVIDGGDNIQLKQTGNTISVATAKEVKFDKVETGNLNVTGDTVLGGNATYNGPITAGDNIVNKDYVDQAIGDNTVSVVAGTNVTVDKNGNEYKVNANDTKLNAGKGVTLTGGDLDSNNVRNYTVAVETAKLNNQNGKVQADQSGDKFATAEDVANAINNTYWTASDGKGGNTQVNPGGIITWKGENGIDVTNTNGTFTITDNTKYQSTVKGLTLDKQGDTVTLGGDLTNFVNQTVKPLQFAGDSGDTLTPSHGDTVNIVGDGNINVVGKNGKLNVKLNPNVDLGDTGSLKTGDTLVNNDGVKVGDKVTLTKDGLDNGGNKITHVADGVDDTDAVNVSQLKQVSGDVTHLNNIVTGGKTNIDIVTYNVEGQTEQHNQSVIEAIDNMNAQGIKFFHTNQTGVNIKVDNKNKVDSSASGAYATAIGVRADASGEYTLAMGNGATASKLNAIAIGANAQAKGEKAISIGAGNVVSGNRSTAIGDPNEITGHESHVLGNENKVSANQTVVVGNNVTADIDNSVYLGNNTAGYKTATQSTAGTEAYATNHEDIKDVNGNVVIAKDELKFAGSHDDTGVVSVGDVGNERRIQNVAPGKLSAESTDAINGSQLYSVAQQVSKVANGGAGPVQYADENGVANGGTPSNDVTLVGADQAAPVTIHNVNAGRAPTDAVNVSQLNQVAGDLNNRIGDVSKHSDASAASAIAVASMPQAFLPGKNLVAIGGGTYHGQTGYAIGVSTISDNGHWIVKGTATGNSKNRYGAGVGAGYQW